MRPRACSPPAGLEGRRHMLGMRVINPRQLQPLCLDYGCGFRFTRRQEPHNADALKRLPFSEVLGTEPRAGPARRLQTPSAEFTPHLPLPAPRRASQPHPGAGPTGSWAVLRDRSCFPGICDGPFPALALLVQPRPLCPQPTFFQPHQPLTTWALWPASAFSTWNRAG